MLQAPSHLSRVCGHSHIKKFWLMQTQNESQACENKSALLASSSLPVPSSSAKGPDSKQSPQRSSGSPGMRSLLAGASSSGRSVRPLLGGAIIPAGYGGVTAASRHTSLVTCAESLSPPVRLDQTYRSFRSPSPDFSAIKFKEENEQRDSAVDCGVLKTPGRQGGFSPSSSQYGSPSEDAEVDLVDNTSREAELTYASNLALPSVKAEATEATNVQLPTGSTVPSVCDSLSSPFKEDLNAEDREHICCNISTSIEAADFSKDLDTSHTESHSLENESSDSGTDDGNFEYLRSPVRGARTIYSDKRARPLDGKALCSGWVSSIPPVLRSDSGKGSRTGELHSDNLPSGNREASPEDANGVRNSVLRICSLCGTSKTPLWRSGPHGPKSLCNACGIRFKKSKRCPVQMEGNDHLASPLASPDVSKPPSRPLKRKQDTFLACEVSCPRDPGSEVAFSEAAFQHQKRSRWPKLMVKREIGGHMVEFTGSSGESCLTLNLHSPSLGSHSSRKLDLNARTQSEFEKLATVEEHRTVGRVIAKDEEEAAVLLMYLSCGLVYA